MGLGSQHIFVTQNPKNVGLGLLGPFLGHFSQFWAIFRLTFAIFGDGLEVQCKFKQNDAKLWKRKRFSVIKHLFSSKIGQIRRFNYEDVQQVGVCGSMLIGF